MINTVKTLSKFVLRKTNIIYCDVVKTRKKIHNICDIPRVTINDIKKILRQKGFAVQDGTTSITTRCCICCNDNKKTDNKIYVNKTTGYFLCPHCSVHGDWNILERLLKKPKLDATTKELIEKCHAEENKFQNDWNKLVKETSSLSNLSDVELQELLKLFEYPDNLDAAKVLSDVRINEDRTTLYFPLVNSLNRVVSYKKIQAGQEDDAESLGLHSAGIFICKLTSKASKQDQAVLVPKIEDIISLAAHKVPGTYIWLSVCTVPLTMLPALESYSKLYLWGDWSNMLSVAEKLGNQRCHFVRPTDGLVTATEAARAGMSLKALVADAKPSAHRSITTFAALRDDVYAELSNIEKTKGVKWRRFPALNKLLGGHRRGELTVLTGPTGCGKTTLCAEMSLDLAQQGVNTLWGSFEIRNSRLARTMLQQSAGVSLEQNLQDFNKYADEFQKLPIYYLAFHGPQSLKVVMEAVEHARYVHDLSHVIVDNVQFMLGVGEDSGDRFWRQDAVVAAFRGFATARHCHVTLVMHPRKERDADDLSTSSIFGSAKASQEADNVLIIQDKRLTAVRGKKYLQIAKNRFSGDLGIVPLDFDKEALSYQTKKRPKTVKPTEDTKTQNTEYIDLTDNDYIEKDVHLYDEGNEYLPNKANDFHHPFSVINTNRNR